MEILAKWNDRTLEAYEYEAILEAIPERGGGPFDQDLEPTTENQPIDGDQDNRHLTEGTNEQRKLIGARGDSVQQYRPKPQPLPAGVRYARDEKTALIKVRRVATSTQRKTTKLFMPNTKFIQIHRDWLFNTRAENAELQRKMYAPEGFAMDPRQIQSGRQIVESIIQLIFSHRGQLPRTFLLRNDPQVH